MDKPYISIIIPVYNGLEHQLSIWKQDWDGIARSLECNPEELYEVICVDDCSPDNTCEWIKEQQKRHPNLRLIRHEVNKRQGGARNTGMRAAKGEYIAFIDQDDCYDKNAFPKVFDALKGKDLDLLIVDATYELPGHPNTKLQHNFPHKEVMTGDQQIARNSIPYAPWKFIFKRNLVIENYLFFNEGERIEDVDWVHHLTHLAEKSQYQPILFIHYLKNDTSTTMTSYKSKVTMHSTVRCGRRLCDLVDTVFANSDIATRNNVRKVGFKMLNLGMRNFLLCRDSISAKRDAIKQNIKIDCQLPTMVKIAYRFPTIFSFASNCTAVFAPTMIRLYRRFRKI